MDDKVRTGDMTSPGSTGTTGGIGKGLLWAGAWALAMVGAKYAWNRARENFGSNVNPTFLDTASNVIGSVVGGSKLKI
jgi:hypothetical protein